jgi:sn-glycerol 3-phosphate transport system ATP-binding protein
MRLEIKKLQRRLETAAIYVTHDQVEAMTLADRIVVLNGGQIEQVGTPAEIYANPATTFVASFIGAPPMNMLEANVTGDALEIEGQSLPFPRSHRGPVRMGLRPERMQINGSDAGLNAEITVLEDLGATRLIHARLGNQEVVLSQDADLPVPSDGKISIAFRPDDVHLFDRDSGRRIDA